MGKLPAWAKKQVEGQVGDKQNGQNKGVDFPKGQYELIIYLSWYGDYNDTCVNGSPWQNYQNKGFVPTSCELLIDQS